MSGGPSHIDTFDMKPGSVNAGDFKPIKTAVSGIEICQHLPTVAREMKHLSIIRSLVTNEGSHERGRTLMHTAYPPSVVVNYPSMGAVVSQQLTPKELALPGFISISRPSEGPGFLGMNYAPFTVQNPGQPPTNIQTPAGVDEYRIRRRQQLFYAVEDTFSAGLTPQMKKDERAKYSDAAQAHTEIYGKAFKLVADRAGKKVFDLNTESASLRAEYGQTGNFGKACLLARKLIETGVTCVEVDLGGWDNHQGIFNTLSRNLLPQLDKGMGTLVKDLADRGLLKNTVVVWLGEFGRTPRINQNAGRDHWRRTGLSSWAAAASRAARFTVQPVPTAPTSKTSRAVSAICSPRSIRASASIRLFKCATPSAGRTTSPARMANPSLHWSANGPGDGAVSA